MSAKKWSDCISKMDPLLASLKNSTPMDIDGLTKGTLDRHLAIQQDRKVAGVYAFFNKSTKKYDYVGRSHHLSNRLGLNHRSLDEKQAHLTKKIKDDRQINMKKARSYLFRNYNVRIVVVADARARALFEIYADTHLSPKYTTNFHES